MMFIILPTLLSALFGRTSDGAINSKELLFDVHQNSTASITLPASALRVEPLSANITTNTRIRIANSVYVNDLLFLRREEESQKVGSIVISASVSSNNRSENLDPPVHLTFKKNAVRITCLVFRPVPFLYVHTLLLRMWRMVRILHAVFGTLQLTVSAVVQHEIVL